MDAGIPYFAWWAHPREDRERREILPPNVVKRASVLVALASLTLRRRPFVRSAPTTGSKAREFRRGNCMALVRLDIRRPAFTKTATASFLQIGIGRRMPRISPPGSPLLISLLWRLQCKCPRRPKRHFARTSYQVPTFCRSNHQGNRGPFPPLRVVFGGSVYQPYVAEGRSAHERV